MIKTLTLNLGYSPETNPDRVLASAARLIGQPTAHASWAKGCDRNVLVVMYALAGINGGTKDLMWRLGELAFEIDQTLIRMYAEGERGVWLATVHSPGFYGDNERPTRACSRLRPAYIKTGKTREFITLDGAPLSEWSKSADGMWPEGLRRTGAQIEFDDGRPGTALNDLLPGLEAPCDPSNSRRFTYADA